MTLKLSLDLLDAWDRMDPEAKRRGLAFVKQLSNEPARNRIADALHDIGQALDLPAGEIDKALASEDELLAFTLRHGQSLDWIVHGDATAMIRTIAKRTPDSVRLADELNDVRHQLAMLDFAVVGIASQGCPTDEAISGIRDTLHDLDDRLVTVREAIHPDVPQAATENEPA